MEFVAWPDIVSFHNVRKYAKSFPETLGASPIVQYRGKPKLDGTNAGVQIYDGDQLLIQSRTQTISIDRDNAGFARWVEGNRQEWLKVRDRAKSDIMIYGEWAGKGIQKGCAVNEVERMLCVFAAQIPGSDDWIVEPTKLQELVEGMTQVYVLPWWGEPISVHWLALDEALEPVVEQINSWVLEVEKCDPFIKSTFGKEGVGEGLVFYPISHPGRTAFSNLGFKAKGEAHKVVKTPKAVQVQAPNAEGATAFAELVLGEARLEQGVRAVNNGELNFDIKNTGKFLGWIGSDIVKECKDELIASGLEWKTAQGAISAKARAWYMSKIKTL